MDPYIVLSAIRSDNVDEFKKYIDAKNVSAWNNCYGYILIKICYYDAIQCLKYAVSIGVELNCVDYNGSCPLHYTAINGYYECTRILLNAGADPNSIDRHNITPINEAIGESAIKVSVVDVIKLLIDYGADVQKASLDNSSKVIPEWVYLFAESRVLCRSVCMVMIGVHKFGLASNVNGRDVFGLLGKHIWSYRMNF
jgi:ankyrin repeat protein